MIWVCMHKTKNNRDKEIQLFDAYESQQNIVSLYHFALNSIKFKKTFGK